MSLTLTVDLCDHATPALQARLASLTPSAMAARVGPACAALVRRHWAALPPNQRGWPSTSFNEAAADSVRWEPTPDGVTISTHKIGARQRYYGGHIRPVNKRALVIPADPDACGKTPPEIPGLRFSFIHGPNTVGSLVTTESKRVRVMFWLSAGVIQPPHPEVLPSREEILATAQRAILSQ